MVLLKKTGEENASDNASEENRAITTENCPPGR